MGTSRGALDPYTNKSWLELILDVLHHLLLPVAALVITQTIATYMYTRSSMVTTMGEGILEPLRQRVVPIWRSDTTTLPAILCCQWLLQRDWILPLLISGALLIEIVFSYPGMGMLLYTALLNRDYPLLQGILLLMAVVILLVNLVIDLFYQKLDPRISHEPN